MRFCANGLVVLRSCAPLEAVARAENSWGGGQVSSQSCDVTNQL